MTIRVYTLPAWTVLYVSSFRDGLKHFTGKKKLPSGGVALETIHDIAASHPGTIKLLLDLSDEDIEMLNHIQANHPFFTGNEIQDIVQAVFLWFLYNDPTQKEQSGVQHERTA